MIPNWITLGRIVFSFAVAFMFEVKSLTINIIALLSIFFIIFLDFLDGYIARKYNMSTEFGAMFDITGDRIVEVIFWTYFAYRHLISFWFPAIILSRGIFTDAIRQQAMKKGIKPYDMFKGGILRFILRSPWMRTGYAVLKVVTFSLLGFVMILRNNNISFPYTQTIHQVAYFFAILTVIVCIIRGIPVFVYARKYVFSK